MFILSTDQSANGLLSTAAWSGIPTEEGSSRDDLTSHKPRCSSGFFRLWFEIEKVTIVAKSNQTLLQASDFSLCCQDLIWFPPRVYNTGYLDLESQVYDD